MANQNIVGTSAKREIIHIEATVQAQPSKLRVAGYCRVSSDSSDQLNSFAAQVNYFDAIVDTNLLTNVRTTAKELRIPERLFTFLLEDMDLAFRTPQRLLIPTAYMMNNGYAVLKEYSRNGHGGVYMLFTPLGRLYLLKRIRERLAIVAKE